MPNERSSAPEREGKASRLGSFVRRSRRVIRLLGETLAEDRRRERALREQSSSEDNSAQTRDDAASPAVPAKQAEVAAAQVAGAQIAAAQVAGAQIAAAQVAGAQ